MKAKFEFILQMIQEIEHYQQKYESVRIVLEDRMALNATLMNLLQIGGTLKKIEETQLKHFDLYQDASGAYATRNFIAHDYEGVNKAIIEDIVRNHLPSLKTKIQTAL